MQCAPASRQSEHTGLSLSHRRFLRYRYVSFCEMGGREAVLDVPLAAIIAGQDSALPGTFVIRLHLNLSLWDE